MTTWSCAAIGTLLFGAFVPNLIAQAGNQDEWTTLDRQAEERYNRGDLKEAIRFASLAVDAASDTKQSAHSLDRLGFFQYTSGDLKSGEKSLRQALELRRTKIGTDTIDYAESANDLALFCRDSGKLPEARQLAGQAVAIRTRAFGPHSPLVAESLDTLGSIYALDGEYELAIDRFEQARAIHESGNGPSALGEEYGTLCINLGGTYQRVGKYKQAETMFEKGLAVLRRRPGINHPAYSSSLTAYAYLQTELGHYSTAEKLYAEAGNLLPVQLGEEHRVYAAFLNNRAALYTALGNRKVAEADYRKSLALKRKLYGPDSPAIGASLRNLARLIYARDPNEGERLFNEAVALYARNAQPPPFDYAAALLGLAEAQRNRGDLHASRGTLERASEVVTKGLGTRHPLYAATLRDLALVDQSAGRYDEAERRFRRAIDIVEQVQGENHPDLAQYLERLAACYEAAGDYRAAEPLYRRSLDISNRTIADMLSVGGERNKSAVLENLDDPVPRLIAFQRHAGGATPGARTLAFEAVASRKGRVLDEVHDWGQRLRESPDPGIRARFGQWEAMLACEASLTVALGYRDLKPSVVGTCSLPGTELADRYERLLHDLRAKWTDASGSQALEAVKTLRQHIDTLEAALSRDVPQFATVVRVPRFEDLCSDLKQDELLIAFVLFEDPDSRVHTARYGAFVVSHSGALEWQDLGASAPIDTAVRDLIAAANDWSVSLAGRESQSALSAEETANDALRLLSEKLGPVTTSIARTPGIRRLRIAPDGMLNLIPFSAVSPRAGRFLLERYAISYLPAGRDLVAASDPALNTTAPVVAVSPGPSATGGVADPFVQTAFRSGLLDRLAGADLEARDVKKWIPGARLLAERESTEQRVKQLRRPELLHIVGHGIVRGKEDCRADPSSPGCKLAAMDAPSRVMSLSAIVLEEAYGRGGASREDGLLTALELQTLDLQGTEMLVLSQCRMADGVPSSGDGVYGMRRAAAIAGVRTFVAPLWRVADDAERMLMDRFYRELSTGKDRAGALRAAQLQLAEKAATRSFLLWAPVILSGDPRPLPHHLFAR